MTDTSSGETITQCAILMPGTSEYETSMEKIYGKRGAPLDMLGRPRKEAPFDDGSKPFSPSNDDMNKEEPVSTKLGDIGKSAQAKPEAEDGKQKVLVFRDHKLEFPELHLRIHVTGPPEDTKGFADLFSRAYCSKAKDIGDADLVVFTGGPDVDPAYYGEKPHPTFCGHDERDYSDIANYLICLEEGIPMFGVCRGAQFLAVMNGAKLVQDMKGHHGDHQMWDKKQKMLLERVSSVHHQAVVPDYKMDVIAVAYVGKDKWLTATHKQVGKADDLEAFFYRDTCCLGVQGHPEYKTYHGFAKWTLDLINEYIILNPDVDWVDEHRRLKPEFLKERDEKDKIKRTSREIITVPSTSSPVAGA